MQELRFVAVSEDGRYAVLAVPGRSARFTLPIDERLRAVALGQTSRLAQYEIEVESPLRPKEIQARIRAGETVEEIADAAGIAVERVRWFEGPVLAERAYIADQAQAASVRRPGESAPGPRLGEITAERLASAGADPDDVQWDARKRGDGNWLVQLTFTSGGRLHTAEWLFDPRRRHVIPADDNAARMSLPGAELPQPAAPGHGEATVTRLAPRLRHDPPAPPARPGPATADPFPEAFGADEREPVEPAQPVAAPFTPAPPPAPQVAAHEPPARNLPPARETSPSRDIPPSRDVPPARDIPASRDVPPARDVPASREVAPARDIASQEVDVTREVTPRDVAASREAPSAEKAPAAGNATPQADSGSAERVTPEAPSTTAPEISSESAADGTPGENTPANGTEQASRPGKKSARGRRSSVPSWDEIMLGSTRQRD